MKRFFLLFFCIAIVTACGKRTYTNQLAEVDSLLVEGQTEIALLALDSMDRQAMNVGEYAYYNLLHTIAEDKLYIPIASDSIITTCVDYYKEHGPKGFLLRSYLYKGAILVEHGRLKEAIECFKIVEESIGNVDSDEIAIKTLVSLAFVNVQTGNLKLAINYSNKALDYAKTSNNKRWIGYSYQILNTIYSIAGQQDDNNYMEKSISYIDAQPIKEKAIYLKNIGVDYYEKGNYTEAERYLERSLGIEQREETFGALADLYVKLGKKEEVDKLWQKAMSTKDKRLRITFYTSYVNWLRENGNYQEASDYAIQVINLKDSFARWQQTEAVREIQEKYDREVVARKNRALVEKLVVVIVVLIVLAAAVIFYSRQKALLARKKLLESNALAEDYSAQIAQLKAEGKEQTKEAQELQRKLERLRTYQRDMLYKGKTLYDSLMSGGNAAQWHKADFVEFMEYYRSIDLPFVLKMEKDYRSLTPGHQTILVFQHLGYTDEQILYLMGMTDGALRTTKSRIKKKKVEEPV